MSQVRVNNITNRTGITGPTVAGIANVNSSSHFVVPTGRTGQRYADEGENIVRDGLVLYLDAKYSYPSKTGIGTTTSGAAAPAGSSTDPDVYNWYDMSGYENNGQLVNGVGYNADNGGSLVFDGVNDHIICLNSQSLWTSHTYTLEIWANRSGAGSVTGRGIMISDNTNYIDVYFGNNYTLASFYVYNDAGAIIQQTISGSIASAAIGTWRHYALTFDGVYGRLYENGSLTGSTLAQGKRVVQTGNTLRIGGYDDGNYFFNGKLNLPKVYNRALTAAEVLQNYNVYKSRFGLS